MIYNGECRLSTTKFDDGQAVVILAVRREKIQRGAFVIPSAAKDDIARTRNWELGTGSGSHH
jgi:hypothetical protein